MRGLKRVMWYLDRTSDTLFFGVLLYLWAVIAVDKHYLLSVITCIIAIWFLACISVVLKYGEYRGRFIRFNVKGFLKSQYPNWEPGILYKCRNTALGGIMRFARNNLGDIF